MKYLDQGNFFYGSIYLFRRGLLYVQSMISTTFYRSVLKHTGKEVRFGVGIYIDNINNIYIGSKCTIGDHVSLHSETVNAKLLISDLVQISNNVSIDYSGGVEIGELSLISQDVQILSHDHGYDPHSAPKANKLIISKNVWIGLGAIVLPGTKFIGENAIIGAGSVVTKPVKPNAIVAGNPARLIKFRNEIANN